MERETAKRTGEGMRWLVLAAAGYAAALLLAQYALPGTWLLPAALAALVLLLPAAPILWKHLENFRRIRAGTEVRMSYLWNKDGELKRTGRA